MKSFLGGATVKIWGRELCAPYTVGTRVCHDPTTTNVFGNHAVFKSSVFLYSTVHEELVRSTNTLRAVVFVVKSIIHESHLS